MTDEVKRVVAGLRYCYRHISCKNLHTGEKCPDYDSCQKKISDNVSRNESLADLIESLAAELEQVKQERDGLNILLGQAQSMLETRTRERDEAVEDIERAESAAEDMRHLLDTDVHPNCDYGLYLSLHDALSDIVAWNYDVNRGTKEG